ncbi:MAG: DUF3703 domain-containing protein [Flavobacteriales bacterium]|nr:DUF3703 domain-containing protein [Flavobacteriales bacterium]MBP6696028.1 DUF3703 domain-containing protein [Flavobacteriales bacterium]
MPGSVRPHYRAELVASERAEANGNLRTAWHHLERAHILGQRWPREHNAVHWRMLKFGLRTKNTREIIGQLPRLVFGGVKSFVGRVPIGNTGGADVSALRPLEVPADLRAILAQTGT